MTDRFPNRIEHLFTEALRKPTKQRRSEFLAETCADDTAVRSRIERLLTAHERAGDFLESSIADSDDWGFVINEELSPVAGERISPSTDSLAFLDPPEGPEELGSFNGYGVTELLGRGGAGIVFKARDRRLNRIVALKVLAPEWAVQPHARRRFLREARAAAAVRHENVVAIHAIDETAALPFLVMEYIAGESLHERIRRDGPLAIGEVLRIGRLAASGLAAAHAQRLVHRDVKPANILLEESTGHVRITDFGLARTVDDVGITQEGMIAGTPQFMSPEQARGNAIDFRSDLFSLGSVLYAMCAGRPPFQAETTLAVMRKICEESAQPIGEIRSETPPELARLIAELLEKDVAKRPSTIAALESRLLRIATDLESKGTSPASERVERTNRWNRRAVVLGTLGATAAVATVIAFGPWNGEPASSPDDSPPENPTTIPVHKPPKQTISRGALDAALFDGSVKPLSEFRRMTVPGQRIDSLAISADGTRVYGGVSNGTIHVWDSRNGDVVTRYPGHRPATLGILLSADGTRMVSFGADRILRVFNPQSGNETLHIRMSMPFRGAALSPDGSEVVVSFVGGKAGAGILQRMKRPAAKGSSNSPAIVFHKLSVYSTATGRRLRFLSSPQTDSYQYVDWSPDGRFIAAGTEEGRVLLFDARSGAVAKDLQASGVPGPTYGVHFSADGKRLYAAGSGNLIWGWELPECGVVFRRRFQFGIVRFAVSPDDRWLAFGGRPEIRLLSIKDPSGNDVLLKLEGHTTAVHSVAFFPNANALASYGRDGTVRLWRLPGDAAKVATTNKPVVRRLQGNDGYAVDANRDGVFETVVTTGSDLRLTRPTGTGTFPREVVLLEFETSPHRGAELAAAYLELRVTLAQSSNRDPTFDVSVHAYAADGKVTPADGHAPAVLAGRLKDLDRKTQGTLRIPLDAAVIRGLMSKSGHVGLRISNATGNRMIFASRKSYFKNSEPTLELHLRPRR